jgi:hypothetical protein
VLSDRRGEVGLGEEVGDIAPRFAEAGGLEGRDPGRGVALDAGSDGVTVAASALIRAAAEVGDLDDRP